MLLFYKFVRVKEEQRWKMLQDHLYFFIVRNVSTFDVKVLTVIIEEACDLITHRRRDGVFFIAFFIEFFYIEIFNFDL